MYSVSAAALQVAASRSLSMVFATGAIAWNALAGMLQQPSVVLQLSPLPAAGPWVIAFTLTPLGSIDPAGLTRVLGCSAAVGGSLMCGM